MSARNAQGFRIRCATCGEAAGGTGSLAGLVHKWGPRGHAFRPTTLTRAYSLARALLAPNLTAEQFAALLDVAERDASAPVWWHDIGAGAATARALWSAGMLREVRALPCGSGPTCAHPGEVVASTQGAALARAIRLAVTQNAAARDEMRRSKRAQRARR